MAEEMEDESLIGEVKEGYEAFIKELDTQTLATLLTGEYDRSNAILSFHAGAGGPTTAPLRTPVQNLLSFPPIINICTPHK